MDLYAFLRDHEIVPEVFEHQPVLTIEESQRLVPRLPGIRTKNLFLRDKKGRRHFLVAVPADLQVDLASLGIALDAERLGFGSVERLQTHLRVNPGAVSVLALVNDAAHAVECVIDARVWRADALLAHPLVNDATMVLKHADLVRFLAATGHVPKIVDLSAAS